MPRKVSPPVSEHARLDPPLTQGEQKVFEFFDTQLDEAWEIYIQPHMNGLRPDFVLLNPYVGIAVFEVKDWKLNEGPYPYRMENTGCGKPILKVGTNANIEGNNPINKINLYREELFELYCPRLGEKAGAKGFAAVTAGVIFPNATGGDVKTLFSPILNFDYEQYLTVSGGDDLDSGHMKRVFPEGVRRNSYLMTPDFANDMRGWLIEPEYNMEQRRPLDLSPDQEKLVSDPIQTVSKLKRLRGPAGSGKSIVIAARASRLATEGKRVLVVCFNVTLVNYLRDLCARWTSQFKRCDLVNEITWIHFHHWCKRTCYELGEKDAYKEFWRIRLGGTDIDESDDSEGSEVDTSVFDHDLAELVETILDKHEGSVMPYDAILVDEGQDFLPEWWNVLRKIKKPEGEMLLVADASQDVYSKARAWTNDVMSGVGFKGGWSQLKGSYRMPTMFLPKLQEFAAHFLPEDLADVPEEQQETFLGSLEGGCYLRWVQTEKPSQMWVCLTEILRLISLDEGEIIPVPDVTVLVSNAKSGFWLAEKLAEQGIKTIDTFATGWKDERRKKRGFYKGAARVKLTTVHSFKGIESRAMVISLGKGGSADMALAYTAMTRLKRSEDSDRGSYLTVVSSHPELTQFGKSWPDFEEVIPNDPESIKF